MNEPRRRVLTGRRPLQHVDGAFVNRRQRRTGTCRLDGLFMGVEHEIIDVALWFRERALRP